MFLKTFVPKPWGHEEIFAQTEHYVGKILVINPGHRLSRQYHNVKEETFRVLKGHLILEIGMVGEIRHLDMHEGDVYHCPAGTVHRMVCDKDEQEAVQIIEVSTNHLQDVVRLQDDYNR